MATGEGGGEGDRGRWTWRKKGEEVCRVVLVIVISIIYRNNTYFASFQLCVANGEPLFEVEYGDKLGYDEDESDST
jgi:hypothetical protein